MSLPTPATPAVAETAVTRSRPWTWWLFGFGLFTGLVIMGAIEARFSVHLMDKEVSWGVLLLRSAQEWYTWGLITLFILWLAGRFPLERERLWTRVPLHVGASLCLGAIYMAALAGMLHGERSLLDGSVLQFQQVFRKMLAGYLLMSMILYWSVVLAHHGWHYYRRSREREIQAAELQTQLVQARLLALRMQLNPHFLFNTLNTISALIHERPEDADRMVVRLSELLRMSIDGGCPHEVPLSRELTFLERYLEVEKIRFEDRLDATFEIESGVRDALVPCLLLQPIVENAIRHGIESLEAGGRVTVTARKVREELELEVTDNGPGLPAGASLPEGIGLTNTRSRLRQLHGEAHRLELLPAPGGGLRVRVVLPFRTLVAAPAPSAPEPLEQTAPATA